MRIMFKPCYVNRFKHGLLHPMIDLINGKCINVSRLYDHYVCSDYDYPYTLSLEYYVCIDNLPQDTIDKLSMKIRKLSNDKNNG